MKRVTVLAATAVLLVSNAWILLSISRNRAEALGGRVELTERELQLSWESGESTALFLDLEWKRSPNPKEHRGAVPWLDTAKLTELGFDCRVPLTHPNARDHYRSQMSALVFLALELRREAPEPAGPDNGSRTRLIAVDAGRDAVRLRGKYPDAARHIITRGLIRLVFLDRTDQDGEPIAEPRLEGRIASVLPDQIFVPAPYNKVLEGLRRRDDPDRESPNPEPRYAVSVSWGANYHPWVTGIRLLPHTDLDAKAP